MESDRRQELTESAVIAAVWRGPQRFRRSLDWRLAQLKSIVGLIQKHEEDIALGVPHHFQLCFDAPGVGRHEARAFRCRADNLRLEFTISPFPGPDGWSHCRGQCRGVEAVEMAPATSALITRLLPLYLDKSAIRVVEGGISETTALLHQKWDKIFYTAVYVIDETFSYCGFLKIEGMKNTFNSFYKENLIDILWVIESNGEKEVSKIEYSGEKKSEKITPLWIGAYCPPDRQCTYLEIHLWGENTLNYY
ncbi:hypothetical protein SELMODRAFT_418100 [Selaginella moellendorffii]|uniref:Uncharacterized protein n=1 Tax=Selaginella moellendorffii TaxID=88036 RepID=D8S4P0_SELML|nr:hypothetical protein SELMODRAFT_418100 [Selaginella moellendorffii]